MTAEREKVLSQKPWSRPELIILTRNKPEENVLGACKNVIGGVGPHLTDAVQCSDVVLCHIPCSDPGPS